MAQVVMQAGPFRIVSLMSREAADKLGLSRGVAVASAKAAGRGRAAARERGEATPGRRSPSRRASLSPVVRRRPVPEPDAAAPAEPQPHRHRVRRGLPHRRPRRARRRFKAAHPLVEIVLN